MPLLVWQDTQPTTCLSDVHPESRSSPASRAWSIWAVSHKPRDLLPSKLLCKSTISTLHLTRPAHGRHQVSYQVQWNSTTWSKSKSANWIPGLAISLEVVHLFAQELTSINFKSLPSSVQHKRSQVALPSHCLEDWAKSEINFFFFFFISLRVTALSH